jgi:hypothetical protein
MLSARMAFEEIVVGVEAVVRAATSIRSQLSGPADPSSWAHWPRRLCAMADSVTLGERQRDRHGSWPRGGHSVAASGLGAAGAGEVA